MNVELVEDGIKITLDPEERNVVRTHSKSILQQVEMQVKMNIRTCIAVETIGKDRMFEILDVISPPSTEAVEGVAKGEDRPIKYQAGRRRAMKEVAWSPTTK